MTTIRGGPPRRSRKKPKESLQELLDAGFGLIFVDVSRPGDRGSSQPTKGLPPEFAPLEGKRPYVFAAKRLPAFPKEDDPDAWLDWLMPRSLYFENVDASPYDLPGIVVVAGRKKPRIIHVARLEGWDQRSAQEGRR